MTQARLKKYEVHYGAHKKKYKDSGVGYCGSGLYFIDTLYGGDNMNGRDFIFNEIYKGALRAGACERFAHDAAVTGLDAYKKNNFKKAHKLVADKIAEAKRRKE